MQVMWSWGVELWISEKASAQLLVLKGWNTMWVAGNRELKISHMTKINKH